MFHYFILFFFVMPAPILTTENQLEANLSAKNYLKHKLYFRDDLNKLSSLDARQLTNILTNPGGPSFWPGNQRYLDFQSALNNEVILTNYILTILDSFCRAQQPTPVPATGKVYFL